MESNKNNRIVFLFMCVMILVLVLVANVNNSEYETRYVKTVSYNNNIIIPDNDMIENIIMNNNENIIIYFKFLIEKKRDKLYYDKNELIINNYIDIEINNTMLKGLYIVSITNESKAFNTMYTKIGFRSDIIYNINNIKDIEKNYTIYSPYNGLVIAIINDKKILNLKDVVHRTDSLIYYYNNSEKYYVMDLDLWMSDLYLENKKIGDNIILRFDNYDLKGNIIYIDDD